jgi:hypothetical protein
VQALRQSETDIDRAGWFTDTKTDTSAEARRSRRSNPDLARGLKHAPGATVARRGPSPPLALPSMRRSRGRTSGLKGAAATWNRNAARALPRKLDLVRGGPLSRIPG